MIAEFLRGASERLMRAERANNMRGGLGGPRRLLTYSGDLPPKAAGPSFCRHP